MVNAQLARIELLFDEGAISPADVPLITVVEWLSLKDEQNVVLVDVRSDVERKVSIIPGAISKEELLADWHRYASCTVVSYCTIGGRSGHFTQLLRRKGIPALNLKGSVLLWAHARQKFVDAEGKETVRVHVGGPKWNLLPPEYEAVW